MLKHGSAGSAASVKKSELENSGGECHKFNVFPPFVIWSKNSGADCHKS